MLLRHVQHVVVLENQLIHLVLSVKAKDCRMNGKKPLCLFLLGLRMGKEFESKVEAILALEEGLPAT